MRERLRYKTNEEFREHKKAQSEARRQRLKDIPRAFPMFSPPPISRFKRGITPRHFTTNEGVVLR